MQAIIETDNVMKIFIDMLLLFVILIGGVVGLDLPAQVVVTALSGSVAGSLVLTYFQRESWLEMVFKVTCSSLSGLFCGAFCQEYLKLEKIAYIGFNYFLASLLSLVVLRALLSTTEKNAVGWVKESVQRVFNLQTKEEKERRKR